MGRPINLANSRGRNRPRLAIHGRAADCIERLEPRRLLSYAVDTQLIGYASFSSGVSDIDVASAPDGRSIAVVHIVRDDIPKEAVMAVRYDAAGRQLGDSFIVTSWPHPNGEGVDPSPFTDPHASVSMDDTGNAIVVYRTSSTATGQTPEAIYVSRISASGVVSSPMLISAPANMYQGLSRATVSMTANGGFFVGWIQTNTYDYPEHPADSTYIEVAAFDASNHKLGESSAGGSLDDIGDPTALDLAAYKDGSGAAYAFSRQYALGDYTNNQTDAIEYGRLDASANRVDASNRILNDVQWPDQFFPEGDGQNIDDVDEPSIAVNDDFTFEIGYRHYATNATAADTSVQAAYVQRFRANGTKRGAPIELAIGLKGDGIRTSTKNVDVAALPGGGFVAVFAQVQPQDTGDFDELYSRTYNAAGVSDSSAPVVVTQRPSQPLDEVGQNTLPSPAIATDARGHARFGYCDAVSPGGFGYTLRLQSDVAAIDGSTLSALGTSNNDDIALSIDGPNLVVTRGAASATFAAADVSAINVDALAGDDGVTNDTTIPSTLEGGDGNDTLYGGSADDRLDGGAGSDSLWGNNGNDRIAGDEDHDYLYGGGGNDRIYGGLQPDFIRGNAGRDKLYGNGGSDVIYGGASADSIYGQGGNDQLFGEGGNDRLYCDYASGNSTLHGGAGNDDLITANALADQLFGDGGHDTATADDIDQLTSIESNA